MTKDEKIQRLHAWIKDVAVWLDIDHNDPLHTVISFEDEPYLRLGKRMFRLTYAGMDFPFRAFPFTGAEVQKMDPPGSLRMRWPTLTFENDDKPRQTIYGDTPEQKLNNTIEFWEQLYERTRTLKAEAKSAIWSKLKCLDLKEAYRTTRIWWASKRWLKKADWLRDLPKRFDPLIGGWPSRDYRVSARTADEAREKIESYFDDHGTPPELRTYKWWAEDGKPVRIHR